MSRTSTRRPEFRLRFGYPYITIDSPDAPPRRLALDREDPVAALRGVAGEIARAGGALTAILPEAEVWRDAAAGPDGLARAAAELGVPPETLAVVHGPASEQGARPVAAVRRETLAEARAFLARAGLKPARITAGGAFPGFAAAPAFRGPATRAGRAAGASVLAASLALLLWLAPWSPETPARVADAPPPAATVGPTPPAPDVAVARVEPAPAARPASLAPPPGARSESPPPAAPVLVTLAGRNLPADLAGPRASLGPALGAVSPPRPRPGAAPALAGRAPDAGAGPLARPAAAQPQRGAALSEGGPRPRPQQRSTASVEILVAALGSAIGAAEAATPSSLPTPVAGNRPLARPAVPTAPVRVAALGSAPATIARFAPVAPPRPTQAPRVAAKQPQPKAAPQPQAARARPAQPARVLQATPQVARVQPQPVQAPRPQPAAAPIRAKAPAAQPDVRRAAAAQPARSRLSERARRQLPGGGREPGPRGDAFALVGIFGGAEGRHALVQLPNGKTERVRAGDDLRGVQVTAIAADAVHLRARGRDSVLKLPD